MSTDLTAVLDRLRRLEDQEAARNLLHAYAETLDDPTPESVAALFTEGGTLTVPIGDFVGREAIADFYRSRFGDDVKRHFLSNVRTRTVEPGLVEVASYFIFTSREPDRSAIGWGTYVDLIRVQDGVAHFERKTITPHMNTDLVDGWPT